MVESLIDRIKKHSGLNKRLFWFQDANDDFLEKVYLTSNCLIAASEGEGLGLPLIEAARYKFPILARDIRVFREIAGNHAFYFPDNNDPEALAKLINQWLEFYKDGKHPKFDGISWLTWEQSAKQLIEKIINDR